MKQSIILRLIAWVSIFSAHLCFCMNPNGNSHAAVSRVAITNPLSKEAIEYYTLHPEHINATLPDNTTPLTKAIICSNYHVARRFLAHGADPNAKADHGSFTPLTLFAQMKRYIKRKEKRFVCSLLRHGAQINGKDLYGYTALMRAAEMCKSYNLIEFLLDQGADPTLRNNLGNDVFYLGININHFAHMKAYFKKLGAYHQAIRKEIQEDPSQFPRELQAIIYSYLSNSYPPRTKRNQAIQKQISIALVCLPRRLRAIVYPYALATHKQEKKALKK